MAGWRSLHNSWLYSWLRRGPTQGLYASCTVITCCIRCSAMAWPHLLDSQEVNSRPPERLSGPLAAHACPTCFSRGSRPRQRTEDSLSPASAVTYLEAHEFALYAEPACERSGKGRYDRRDMEELIATSCGIAFTFLCWNDVSEYILREVVSTAFDAQAPPLVVVPQLTEHRTSRSPASVLAMLPANSLPQVRRLAWI